jgi:hypothetical protein
MLKKLLIVLAFVSVSKTIYAQRSELGFGVGVFNYTGDLVRNYNLKYAKPAVTVFYRANINKIVSFRTTLPLVKWELKKNPLTRSRYNAMHRSIFFCLKQRWAWSIIS